MDTATLPKPLSIDEQALVEALGRVLMVLPRLIEHELLREQRMSMSEYMTLQTIAEAPNRRLRMTDLALSCHLSLSGMTRIVTRLENEGWVERVRCPEDARGANAQLTDAGMQRLQQALPSHVASLRRHIFDPLTRTDLAAFTRALDSLMPSLHDGQGECTKDKDDHSNCPGAHTAN